MKSAAVILAAVAGAAAWGNSTGVVYTTEVVTAITTYCPAATTLTHGSSTITVTAPTTITITNCPCTITRPITTTSSVYCNTCNTTSTSVPIGTLSSTTTTSSPSSVVTAGANKALIGSGAGLAGALGIAAFFL